MTVLAMWSLENVEIFIYLCPTEILKYVLLNLHEIYQLHSSWKFWDIDVVMVVQV